jgi:ribonuclease Z
VDGLLAMLAPDIGFRRAHHDDLTGPPGIAVTEHDGGVLLDDADAGVRIVAAPTDHRPVAPTLGYRVEHDGRAVVIGGDGVPCAGLDELCAGADAYVQTVIREDLVRNVPIPRLHDIVTYHSTVRQAAETAERNGVGRLVLTHQVPTPVPGSAAEWVAIAAEVFTGEIVFGEDLTRLAV